MSEPRLVLRCGCVVPFDKTAVTTDSEGRVLCGSHGPHAIVRTVGMPKPSIRGSATGPLVETADLGVFIGLIAPSAALPAQES